MKSTPFNFAFLFSGIYLLLLLGTLWFPPIGSSSEAREGQVISVMIRSGEYILPLRNGLIPSKPPLYHWTALPVAFLAGRVSPFVARVPAAVYGALVLFLTMLLAAAWAGSDDPERGRKAGFTAGALLSLTYGFTALALQARVDMALAFFTVLALYFALRGLNAHHDAAIPARDFNLCLTACGFAVLAKGPLGVILPILIIAAILVFDHGWRAALSFLIRPRLGWLLFLLIALPWYVLAYQHGREAFIARQVFTENLSRFFGNPGGEFQPPWFYIPHLLRTAFPWSLLFIAGLLAERRKGAGVQQENPALKRAKRAALIWFAAGFLLFSASSGKRASYLLPLYPAISIWLALRWQVQAPAWLHHRRLTHAAAIALSLAFAAALVLAAAALVLPPVSEPILVIAAAAFHRIALPVALIALGGAGLLVLRKPHALYLAALIALVLSRQAGDAVKQSLKEFEPYSEEIRALVPADAKLLVVKDALDEHFDALFFYLNREVTIAEPGRAAVPCPAYVLCRTAICEAIPRAAGCHWTTLRTFNTASDTAQGRTDRQAVLSRCAAAS